jgi:hypothetical protein
MLILYSPAALFSRASIILIMLAILLLLVVSQAARQRLLASSSNNSSTSGSLADMPHEVLVHVMRHVPLRQRLGACALACCALQAAAVAATSVFSLHRLASQQQMDAVAAWLDRHSRPALKQLCLRRKGKWANGVPTLRLPWPCLTQLETLQLHGVLLAPDDAAEWQEAPAAGSSSIGLGTLTGLQQLELKSLLAPGDWVEGESAYSTALGSALGQLVQLTALTISFAESAELDCDAVLARCSSLTRLQHAVIGLGTPDEPMPFNWQDLPASLTQLTVYDTFFDSASLPHDVGVSSSGQRSAVSPAEAGTEPSPCLSIQPVCGDVQLVPPAAGSCLRLAQTFTREQCRHACWGAATAAPAITLTDLVQCKASSCSSRLCSTYSKQPPDQPHSARLRHSNSGSTVHV